MDNSPPPGFKVTSIEITLKKLSFEGQEINDLSSYISSNVFQAVILQRVSVCQACYSLNFLKYVVLIFIRAHMVVKIKHEGLSVKFVNEAYLDLDT